MKKSLVFLVAIIICITTYCQAPQALNYQAIARNADGSIISNQSVTVKFTVLENSANGTAIYQETHLATTNNFGLFTLSIGKGNATSGNFSSINWGSGSKFLSVEIALKGNAFSLQGTTQLLSVPYALYAEKSGSGAKGEQGVAGPTGPTGPQGLQGVQGAQGPAGPQGPTGAQGDRGLQGAAGPQGVPGPIGITGLTGPAGPQGQTGPQGLNGKTILSGTVAPAANIGTDGDFYLNTASLEIFGPKTAGNWGSPASLKGNQGTPGLKSLIAIENVLTSPDCPLGGVIVKTGVDQNNNNVLDASEVDNSKPICFSQNVALDKQIILPISAMGPSFSGTSSTTPQQFGALLKFNKHNYPGVDSIIFVCTPWVGDASYTANLQLYNLTDNLPIANTSIVTNNLFNNSNPVGTILQTKNLYDYLPDYDVTLTVSLFSGAANRLVSAGYCYLYLFRK
ncbi:hypothetical protein QEG73_24640 [Chitinophagaceae bacterium 26-R-25]|nr:hypothetical protein [Chitinophagaceae bacterium 26-R-25]